MTVRARRVRTVTLLTATAALGWFAVDLDPRAALLIGAGWGALVVGLARWQDAGVAIADAFVLRRALIDLWGSARFLWHPDWRAEVGEDDDVYLALRNAAIALGAEAPAEPTSID